MRKFLFVSAAAAVLLALPPVGWGQAPIEKEAPVVKTINLTLEQQHVIKELIKDSKLEKAPADVHLAVGGKVPDSVSLHPMPAEIGAKVSQVKSHLVLLQDPGPQIFIVDPKDRTVDAVIE